MANVRKGIKRGNVLVRKGIKTATIDDSDIEVWENSGWVVEGKIITKIRRKKSKVEVSKEVKVAEEEVVKEEEKKEEPKKRLKRQDPEEKK